MSECLAEAAPFYQDDLATLYCGDNLVETSWLDADILVADPPYGRSWKQGDSKKKLGYGNEKSNARNPITGDNSTEARDSVLKLWGLDRPALVFGDFKLAPPIGTLAVLVYKKPDGTGFFGSVGGYARDVEAKYLIGRGWGSGLGGRSSLIKTRAPGVSGSGGIVTLAGGHPHSKPVDVLEELLSHAPAGCVADPFAGGGSILVAAKQAGRKSIGVEIEQKWCAVAARRLAQDCLPLG